MGNVDDKTNDDRTTQDSDDTFLGQLAAVDDKDGLRGLLNAWNGRNEEEPEWADSPSRYCQFGNQFLRKGLCQIAKEVAQAGLKVTKRNERGVEYQPWSENTELRLLLGISLARTANTEKAQEVLWKLHHDLASLTEVNPNRAPREDILRSQHLTVSSVAHKKSDPSNHIVQEVIGTLARTYKDQARLIDDLSARRELLQRSCELYEEAYRLTGGYWTGINVVTLSHLIGRDERAAAVARDVQSQCVAELKRLPETARNRFWVLSTLGEIAANQRHFDDASKYYREAWQHGRERYGDLCTTRRQAGWLLNHWGDDASLIDEWMPMPRVVVCVGHMVDKPDRAHPRFPPYLTEVVRNSITSWLKRQNAFIGFSSAACGTDILFQEAMFGLGGECHVVLPCYQDDFLHDSVDFRNDGNWGQRFDGVLQRATKTVYSSPTKLGTEGATFLYGNDILHGLAMQRANELETNLEGLAVWDGRPGDGRGGTADVVAQWHARELPIYRVDVSTLPQSSAVDLPVIFEKRPTFLKRERSVATATNDYCVMAMLFADAVGFSKFRDSDVPLFVKEFLGRIAALVQRYEATRAHALVDRSSIASDNPIAALSSEILERAIPVRETWGDGLFFAFWSLSVAGNFALDLLDLVQNTDWVNVGLSKQLGVRIALHAGPVHPTIDPITTMPKSAGAHVSRAARLEPVTPPGEIYASEAFAALSTLHGVAGFKCDYVKQLGWAKHYGSFPTFLITRSK